ncbi:MAG: cyanoexosortase A [Microcystaceae cyanobacterium]
MESLRIPTVEDLKTNQFWLLAIAGCLIAVHFTLSDRTGDSDFLGLSLIVWFAIALLIRRKYQTLNLNSSLPATLVGASLIAIVLMRSISSTTNAGVTLIPLMGGLGLALLASGFQGLRQYWRELLILSLLLISTDSLQTVVNLSTPLAYVVTRFVGYGLWYAGFQVSIEGNHIYLPAGGIVVNDVCAGLGNLLYILKVAIIFLLLFPLQGWLKRLFVALFALTMAFVMNIFRVALLAVLAPSDTKAFDYWHEGQGSLVFTLMMMIVFGAFYFTLLGRETVES